MAPCVPCDTGKRELISGSDPRQHDAWSEGRLLQIAFLCSPDKARNLAPFSNSAGIQTSSVFIFKLTLYNETLAI